MRKPRTHRQPDDLRKADHVNSIARPARGPKVLRTRNARRAVAIRPPQKADPSSAEIGPKVALEFPAVPRVDAVLCRPSSPHSMRMETA